MGQVCIELADIYTVLCGNGSDNCFYLLLLYVRELMGTVSGSLLQ